MISDKTIVFAGSSLFSVPILKAVVDLGFQSTIVLTQPPKKQGRGLQKKSNPTMELAEELDLQTITIENFDDEKAKKIFSSISPDVFLSAAYGKLIPNWFFELFSCEVLNVHPSLLPAWRGASPIQSAILNGDKATGISIMRMTKQIDEGPVFLSEKINIDRKDTFISLSEKLSKLAGRIIEKSLEQILSGEIKAQEQDHDNATFSKKIQKSDGRVAWENTAESIDRKVKAYNPWPMAFTHLGEQYLRIWDTDLSSDNNNYNKPGSVIEHNQDGVLVSTGEGNLLIKKIQPAGKESMDASAFARGINLKDKIFH
tara:strand:- start:113 stop:1054 length:942 start_codon:yes stop_codon:yes gene_type:complete